MEQTFFPSKSLHHRDTAIFWSCLFAICNLSWPLQVTLLLYITYYRFIFSLEPQTDNTIDSSWTSPAKVMKELSFRHLDTSQLEIDLNWDPFINTLFNTKLVEDIHLKLSDEELIFSLSADSEMFKELYEKFPQVQLHGKFFAKQFMLMD